MDDTRSKQIAEFVAYAKTLKGDEKGEAQVFLDRLFRAFSRGGYKEAGATLEERVKNVEGGTRFAGAQSCHRHAGQRLADGEWNARSAVPVAVEEQEGRWRGLVGKDLRRKLFAGVAAAEAEFDARPRHQAAQGRVGHD